MRNDAPHTVLVVDDEEPILLLVEHHLVDLPFVVIPTPSGAEAIHILQSRQISVLLCDLNMPGIDGCEVLATAKKNNPNTVSIVLTASLDQTQTIRAINEGGIWKFLTKPWKKEELVGMVSDGARLYAQRTRQQNRLEELAKEARTSMGPKASDEPPAGGLLNTVDLSASDTWSGDVSPTMLGNNRYFVKKLLGEGGLGTVYLADDQLLNMPVAIKVLKPSVTRDRHAMAALRHEARIAMQLSHRHIVRIHNLQEDNKRYYLVMEYVPGHTLWDILRRYKQLPLDTVLQIVRVCADALAYAHRHKVIHRDLKPSNLLLDERGVLKVIDFGTAALKDSQETCTHLMGTPVYMSPEQVLGEKLDERTDVYALGAVTYEFLTGKPLFPHDTEDWTALSTARRVVRDVPDRIAQVLDKALVVDRTHRWPTVEAFSSSLLEAAQG
ncbi:MAG TPA: hypothetical protein DCZ95_07190 [Verrucomicrobia bacterium]|nr:MAG: hypothetical protein A2X46_05480 [Lentisphaerae bacterium GWF2_57_35]HBA83859.1 hypothetical protein [Verrucomicrobiota bacterium]